MPGVNPDPHDSSCLLHIPHKEAPRDLDRFLAEINDRLTPFQRRELSLITSRLENNFLAIERWATHFYRDCLCDCGGGATGGAVGITGTALFKSNAVTIDVTRPNVVEGQLMIVILHYRFSAGSGSFTTPTGWNLVFNITNTTGVGTQAFSRVATSAEPATYTFTRNVAVAERQYAWMAVLNGFTDTHLSNTAQENNFDGDFEIPSLTVPPDAFVFWSVTHQYGVVGASSITPPGPESTIYNLGPDTTVDQLSACTAGGVSNNGGVLGTRLFSIPAAGNVCGAVWTCAAA